MSTSQLTRFRLPAIAAALLLSTPAWADQSDANYVPYPGRIPVDIQAVVSPIAAWVRFESYPGFNRLFKLNIPGLEVPSQASDSACERRLAVDAMAFTEQFLAEAEEVSMQDMHVVTSTDDDGYAPIYTNEGSLGAKLQAKGLARSSSTAPNQPWCSDGDN